MAKSIVHSNATNTGVSKLEQTLRQLADEMQAASSRGLPVTHEWLDRRISIARAVLTGNTTEGHANVSGPTDQPTPETDAITCFLNEDEFSSGKVVALCRKLERSRDELVEALRELVTAEEEYGDPSNVAVNQAWLKARTLLDRVEAK